MSEEQLEAQEAEETTTVSPAEEKARNSGWVPVGEWGGDEADWVDFQEFNVRGELMGRINEQSSIINHLKDKVTTRDSALDDMVALQDKIAKKAYNDALSDLKKQKADAMEAEDFNGVVDIDDQIQDLKAQEPQVTPQPQAPANSDVPPEIVSWMAKPENQWYHSDMTLRSIADGIASGIQTETPNITPAALLKKVEEKLHQELPHRFNKAPNQQEVDSGGDYSGSTRRKSVSKPKFSDLSEEQQLVARRFEKIGVMKRQEYIESLQEAGEL